MSKQCLNCGTVTEGRYCPECGQSTATQRFTMRSFGVHLTSSVTRVSGDFLRTAWWLVTKPWQVIRNYIYGRRVGLVSPVAMLLLMALYWGVVLSLVPQLGYNEQMESLQLSGATKWLYGSITFQYLFLAIPIALGTWLVYRKDMRRRFNFAELLVATLYLASTFLIVDLILFPLELLGAEARMLSGVMVVVIMGIYSVLSLKRAFPQATTHRLVLKLVLWCLVSCTLLFLFLLIFAIPMYGALI